jgi:hypothetical protein
MDALPLLVGNLFDRYFVFCRGDQLGELSNRKATVRLISKELYGKPSPSVREQFKQIIFRERDLVCLSVQTMKLALGFQH